MATTASHTSMDEFISDSSAQFLSDLQGLLEKAGRFTGATSAAIAFVERDELVTKVSMGTCAPDPGSRSPISGSFTGLCVQQRDVQRCDDASKDSRVDSAACNSLGIASMVIVPIAEKRNVYGVLAAFSPKPNAFSPTHVALLRTVADIVIELRKRYPADPHPAGFGKVEAKETADPKVESPLVHSAPEVKAVAIKVPEVKVPEVKAVSTALPSFASAAQQSKPELAAFSVEKPAATNSAAELHASMAAIPVPTEPKKVEPEVELTKPELSKPVETSKAEEVENTPAVKKPLRPVLVKPEPKVKLEHTVDLWKREPLLIKPVEDEPAEYARLITEEPKKNEEIVSTAADIGLGSFGPSPEPEQPMFGSYGYSESAARKKDGGLPKWKLAFAGLALAVFAGTATWFFKTHAPKALPETVQAAAPQVEPAPASVQPAPAPHVAPAPVETQPSNAHGVAVVIKKADLKLPNSAGKKDGSDKPSVVEDRTIVLSNRNAAPKPAANEDVEAPKVAVADASVMKNILNMVKPAQPEAAFRSSSIAAPVLLKSVQPQFPTFARQMHIPNDRVVLNGTVGKDGSVTNIKVVRGRQVFVDAAISAVRQWKYKPAMLNGEPTSSTIEIVMNFVDR
ncbi:MAG: TonB family protein [Acidobacteriaceae bacterium]